MQTVHVPTVSADLIRGKKVLLRYDIDIPIENGQITDDFRLKAGLPTLKLCLENASQVILLGHVGRPNGFDSRFSVAPIFKWLNDKGFGEELKNDQLKLLENLRFEAGEDGCSLEYAKQLAVMGNFYVNEAFAAYHKAASTTVLPSLLPHAAGLRFADEVRVLNGVRNNPKKPLVAVLGGAKIEDKIKVIQTLAEQANAVLVGGKLASQIHEESFNFPHNVLAANLTPDGFDIAPASLEAWKPILNQAKMIVWNGPVGKVEELVFQKGTADLARIILESQAEVVVGGGDTVGFLEKNLLLPRFEDKGFVSVGGGAMLELLAEGTLDTIEVLN